MTIPLGTFRIITSASSDILIGTPIPPNNLDALIDADGLKEEVPCQLMVRGFLFTPSPLTLLKIVKSLPIPDFFSYIWMVFKYHRPYCFMQSIKRALPMLRTFITMVYKAETPP
jgi:hypothetical protein